MHLKMLDDAALEAFSPERLLNLIARVQQYINTATAYQQRLIAIAEKRKAARSVGDISTADSLVRATGISRRSARRAQRQARIIATQPQVAAALAAGKINPEQAETIARAQLSDSSRARLLETAATGECADTTRLRAAAAETEERNETPEERFMRQRSKRFLRFYNNHDGMVCMRGAMDPDTGARIKARITAIANRMWRQDKKQPPKHRRTPEQREIDALHAATAPPVGAHPTSTAADTIPIPPADNSPSASLGTGGPRRALAHPIPPADNSPSASADGARPGSLRRSGSSSRDTAMPEGQPTPHSGRGEPKPQNLQTPHHHPKHDHSQNTANNSSAPEPQRNRSDSDRANYRHHNNGDIHPKTTPTSTDSTTNSLKPSSRPDPPDPNNDNITDSTVDSTDCSANDPAHNADSTDCSAADPAHKADSASTVERTDCSAADPAHNADPAHKADSASTVERTDCSAADPAHNADSASTVERTDCSAADPAHNADPVSTVERTDCSAADPAHNADSASTVERNTDTANNPANGSHNDANTTPTGGFGGYRWRDQALPVMRISTSLENLQSLLHDAGVTDTGENLSAETLRRLACDAQIIPTVLNSKSRVIDVGRRTRTISEALRIAVIHRDEHCVWPGCATPPHRCDCHHVKHWINGGPTNLDNLALLCHRHHILLHEAHYKLQRHNNTWTALKPDNTPLHPNTPPRFARKPTLNELKPDNTPLHPNTHQHHSHPLII